MDSNDQKILKEEIELIVADIKQAYRNSGKKATGNFEDGIEVVYEFNKATIRGFTYLAGRGKTLATEANDPTLKERILEWIKAKSIKPKGNITLKALAFLISRKIHREGTDKKRHLKIYEQIITEERIFAIIDRFAEINVNRIVTQITAELQILAKNV